MLQTKNLDPVINDKANKVLREAERVITHKLFATSIKQKRSDSIRDTDFFPIFSFMCKLTNTICYNFPHDNKKKTFEFIQS